MKTFLTGALVFDLKSATTVGMAGDDEEAKEEDEGSGLNTS